MFFTWKINTSWKKSKLRKLFVHRQREVFSKKDLQNKESTDHLYSHGHFDNFKYSKFVPAQFYTEESSRVELEIIPTYQICLEYTPDHFSSEKHQDIMINLAKLVTSGVFCGCALPEKIVKKLEHRAEKYVANIHEEDTQYLFIVMKQMHKLRKLVKKTSHIKKSSVFHIDKEEKSDNNDGLKACDSYEMDMTANITGVNTVVPEDLNMNENSNEDFNINSHSFSKICITEDTEVNGTSPLCTGIHNFESDQECDIKRLAEAVMKASTGFQSNNKISKSSLLKLNFDYKKSDRLLLNLKKSGRFGITNESHLQAVAKLVEDRLLGNNKENVLLYLDYRHGESLKLKSLKLEMAKECLELYFFPSKNSVIVQHKDHLGQCMSDNLGHSKDKIKDIFDRHHRDVFDFKAAMFVSKTAAALMKHKNMCILDTLSVILGLQREMILILNMIDKPKLLK